MALTKTDKSMLGGVDDDNSPSSLVERTNDGRVKVSDGVDIDDAVSKGQVDAELEHLVQNSNTVNVVADGGTLSSEQANELQVAGTFNFPAANSVPANTKIEVLVKDLYKAGIKALATAGTDTVAWTDNSDNVVNIPDGASGMFYFVSNGVDKWRF